ncbi:MAG: tol-pal system protein YbgF [Betaproteobacteria bacterium]|nr:tol-pal system protein YbgF [Betaproteobacteria bacterium]
MGVQRTACALCIASLLWASAPVLGEESILLAQADIVRGDKNRGVIELMNQMEALSADVNRMRGQIEVLSNAIEGAQKRQKDMYLDLDSRMRRFEQDASPENQAKREKHLSDLEARIKRLEQEANADTAKRDKQIGDFEARIRKLEQQAVGTASAAAAQDVVRRAYDGAMNNYKMGDYQGAVSAFDAFIKRYPTDAMAANAKYWIGDSYFNLHDFRAAVGAQQVLIKTYPESSKIPDAMLNLGSAYAALNETSSARSTLEDLIAKYPSSEAADKARQRLSRLK